MNLASLIGDGSYHPLEDRGRACGILELGDEAIDLSAGALADRLAETGGRVGMVRPPERVGAGPTERLA